MENTTDTGANLDHATPEELSGDGDLAKVEACSFKLAILRSFRTRVDNVSGLLIGTETVGEDATRRKYGTG